MAEIVGFAASIASLLQITAQITKLSYAYLSDVKNAPKVQKKYLQEVSALADVLFRVEQAVAEAESAGLIPLRPPSLPDAVLLDCQAQLSVLRSDLEKRVRRLSWPFEEKELKKYIGSLNRLRSIFADFLSANIMIATTATYKKLENLSLEQDKYQLIALLDDDDQFPRTRPEPCPGTGRWFLDDQRYKDWRDGSENLLWCYGSPGVGKSLIASLVIDDLRGSSAPVAYYFCDFSSREQQTPVTILRSLLRQIVEQSTPESISQVKLLCGDPSKLRSAGGLSEILAESCSSRRFYLVLDGPDELDSPQKVLSYMVTLSENGSKVLCTSRNLKTICKQLRQASQLEIKATSQDLRLYVGNRFHESEFSDDSDNLCTLTDDLVSKSGKIFLLAKIMLDQILELPTIRQMREALQSFPSSLHGVYKNTIMRINTQPKPKKVLAHRLISWITCAKRRMTIEEIVDALALEEGDEEIHPESVLKADALVSLCLGLVEIDKRDHTLCLIHSSADEYLRKAMGEDVELYIGKTLLLYLSMKTLRNGPCTTSSDMVDRLHCLPLLRYAAGYLGDHIANENAEAALKDPLLTLLRNGNSMVAAFQAVQFRSVFDGDLTEAIFFSIPTGQTALHVAAFWGLKHTMALLLEHCANPSPIDTQHWTPLHWSCSRGYYETARILIDNGAKINAKDSEGWTPLFWASFMGNEETVRLLLKNDADHLARSGRGWTALHWAVAAGHHTAAKALLEHHSSFLVKNYFMPLRHLSYQEAATLAKVRIQETQSAVPLEIAAEAGHTDIFDTLIQCYHASNFSLNDDAFNSIWAEEAFDNPVANPWRTFLKLGYTTYGKASSIPMLSRGKNLSHRQEMTPNEKTWKSMLLMSAIRDNRLLAMKLLIKCGADVNFDCTSTPLHAAAYKVDPMFCQALLDHGAKPTGVDKRGYTALHLAIMNGFTDTATALIRAGADVNKRVDGSDHPSHPFHRIGHFLVNEFRFGSATPLILACALALDDPKTCDLACSLTRELIAHGADPDAKDDGGLTALHYAACGPSPSLVEMLLEAKAHPDVIDKQRQNVFHFMAKYCNIDCTPDTLRRVVEAITSRIPAENRPQTFNQPSDANDIWDSPSFRRGYNFENRNATPTTLALNYWRWNVLQIFEEMGGKIPDSYSLTRILYDTIQQLEAVSAIELIKRGARPEISSILYLTKAAAKKTDVPWRSDFPVLKTMMHEPCLERYKLILSKLIAFKEVDINYVDKDTGFSAILTAAKLTDSEAIIQTLLDHGADPYFQHEILGDSFMTAALFGNTSILRYLLNRARQRNKRHNWHRALTALEGQPHSDYDVVAFGLRHEHLIEQPRGEGRTILHLAAWLSHPQFASSLLQQGANTTMRDDKGFLPIHYAILGNNLEGVALLFPADAKSNLDLSQPLPSRRESFWKKSRFYPDYNKFNVENRHIEIWFTLIFAIENNLSEIVSRLLEIGADPNQPSICIDTDSGNYYIQNWTKRKFTPLESSNVKEYYPYYPIHSAAKSGNIHIFLALLRAGANITQPDDKGWQPLHIAARYGHTEILRCLLDAGADIAQSEDDGWQPLHFAVLYGHTEIVRCLLGASADIRATTKKQKADVRTYTVEGWQTLPLCELTALHIALTTRRIHLMPGEPLDKPRLELARLLIGAGADVNGVGDHLTLEDVPKFQGFEDVWDRVMEISPKVEE